jgi:hypothetical protein
VDKEEFITVRPGYIVTSQQVMEWDKRGRKIIN